MERLPRSPQHDQPAAITVGFRPPLTPWVPNPARFEAHAGASHDWELI